MLRCRISKLLLASIVPVGLVSPLLAASPPATAQAPPSVVSLLPADTAAMLMLNTTPEAWRELDRFNPYPGFFPPDFLGPLLQVDSRSEAEVQSWIGDRAVIALLPATSASPSWDAHAVLIASSRDPLRTRAFVDRFKALRGQPQIERTYKGVSIIQWTGDKSAPALPSVPSVIPKETKLPEIPLLGFSGDQQGEQQTDGDRLLSQTKPLPRRPLPRPTPATPGNPPGVDDSVPPAPRSRSRSLAIALLPNHLVMANQAEALEKLIDAQSEKTSLVSAPKFQRTLQHPQFGRSLLVGYGNVTSLAPFLAAISTPLPPDVPSQGDVPWLRAATLPASPIPTRGFDPAMLERLKRDYSTIDVLTWVQPQGLRTQSHSYYTSPKPQVATPDVPLANQIISRLPAATYLSANSYNFKRQWALFLKTIEGNTAATTSLQKFRTEFTQQTQLDLEKDVIAWMDKGYAITLFPTAQGLFNTLSPGLNLEAGLLIQTSDRPKAEAALKKLAQAAKSLSFGSVEIVERTIKGQPIVSWEGRDATSLLSYTWSGDTLLVATGVGAMSSLYPKPYLTLDSSYTFRTATEGFGKPNEGFLFVNMGSSLALLYGLILPKASAGSPAQSSYVREIQRVLGIFRSYSSSNSLTPFGEQIDSLLVLSPRKQP